MLSKYAAINILLVFFPEKKTFLSVLMKTREFNFQEFNDLNSQLRFQESNPEDSF